MNNAIQLLVDIFIKEVRPAAKELKKTKPVRIKIKSTGEWLLTPSGKTIWKRKGDAANALALFLEQLWGDKFKYDSRANKSGDIIYKGPDGNHYTYKQAFVLRHRAKEQIKKELIEFVEVDS